MARRYSVADEPCDASAEADFNVLGTIVFDLGRFGVNVVASPRHADGLVVIGPVTQNMKLALQKTYAAMPDPALLFDATSELERRTGVPTLGVLPMLPLTALDAEDSLALDRGYPPSGPALADGLDVAVVRFPFTSNATDVDALATGSEPQYRVIRNAPKEVSREDLKSLFTAAMKYW